MTDITDIYQEVVRIKAEGEDAALVTVVTAEGSTPRGEDAKMLVRADGSIMGTIGGGKIEARVIKEAVEGLRKDEPQRLCFSLKERWELEMIYGGDTEVFIEPILSLPTLYIFGGGHIAITLAKVGKMIGFKIAVIDDRPEFAHPERFPEAELTLAEDFAKSFQKLKINKLSYIVIVTHGHKGDEAVLEGALATEAKYIGMIGSRAKNQIVFSNLLAQGISQKQLGRVHTPIGLNIHAQTTDEIAISILAEIIQTRRSPSAGTRTAGHFTE
jgi:xanthine dehydrogenase accessory factor